MGGLPKGFVRGMVAGGVLAFLWGVLADSGRRSKVGGEILEKAEAVPYLGARIGVALSDQLMQGIYRSVAEDVVARARSGEMLELGSGTGSLAIELGRRARDLQISTMDPSTHRVQVAESRIHGSGLGRQVKVVHGDAGDIPFPDGSFDLVVSLESYRRGGEPEVVLGEIYRVLRPGGKALVYDFRPELPGEAWDGIRRRLPPLQRLLFDSDILASWKGAYNESQIDLYASASPFREAEIVPLEVEIAGTRAQAITRATLRK